MVIISCPCPPFSFPPPFSKPAAPCSNISITIPMSPAAFSAKPRKCPPFFFKSVCMDCGGDSDDGGENEWEPGSDLNRKLGLSHRNVRLGSTHSSLITEFPSRLVPSAFPLTIHRIIIITYQGRIELYHRSRVQHRNSIVINQREDAMGNGKEGRSLKFGANGLLYQPVRLGVHCG